MRIAARHDGHRLDRVVLHRVQAIADLDAEHVRLARAGDLLGLAVALGVAAAVSKHIDRRTTGQRDSQGKRGDNCGGTTAYRANTLIDCHYARGALISWRFCFVSETETQPSPKW